MSKRKAPFKHFEIKPNGWGCGHFTVTVWPRQGFFESLWEVFNPDVRELLSSTQERFIAEAIEEKLNREQP